MLSITSVMNARAATSLWRLTIKVPSGAQVFGIRSPVDSYGTRERLVQQFTGPCALVARLRSGVVVWCVPFLFSCRVNLTMLCLKTCSSFGSGWVDHRPRQRARYQHDRLAARLFGRPAEHAQRRQPGDQAGGGHRSLGLLEVSVCECISLS